MLWITLPETNSSHLKMDGWNTIYFPFGVGKVYFSVAFTGSFQGGIYHLSHGSVMPIPRNSQADQGAYVTGMFLVAHEEAFTHLTLKHPKSPSQKMPKVLQTTKHFKE